jgi:hypothetical protein
LLLGLKCKSYKRIKISEKDKKKEEKKEKKGEADRAAQSGPTARPTRSIPESLTTTSLFP